MKYSNSIYTGCFLLVPKRHFCVMGFKLNWFSLIIDKQKEMTFRKEQKTTLYLENISGYFAAARFPQFRHLQKFISHIFGEEMRWSSIWEMPFVHFAQFCTFSQTNLDGSRDKKSGDHDCANVFPTQLIPPNYLQKKPFCANALHFYAFFVQFFPRQKLRLC